LKEIELHAEKYNKHSKLNNQQNWNGGTIQPFNNNKNLHSENEQDIHVRYATLMRKMATALI
jgi:hypothetical protein